jgi:CDP-diglyceride synthetase
MADDFDEFNDMDDDLGRSAGPGTEEVHEDPPSYRSGRVRIIGAEPAGDAVHEVTGPVVEDHPELPHWNEAPTGQVPAVLDRSTGEEQAVAPPMWREEATDWEAQEEAFEPSMLSDDLPAVGALLEEQSVDVERQPWHFETDDTLVIPPEPGLDVEPELPPLPAQPSGWSEPRREPEPDAETEFEPAFEAQSPSDAQPVREAGTLRDSEPTTVYEPDFGNGDAARPVPASAVAAGSSAAAAARLSPPAPPPPRARTPRTARASRNGAARTGNVAAGGTSGRDMRVAIGTGVVLGVIALICFALGTVAAMVIVCLVVLLATAEAYAAFRRAHYHPATLLGLVAVLSLLIETYNKGVAALPLVLVLLVAGSFIWYLARVEPAAEPVAGITSTVFVFVWVGAFGSFAALLLNPNLFPDRHGIAFVLAAVIVTVADDVASLLVGSAMGRHQLAPSISPNKSWEGLIGGAIAAILVSVIVVHFIHPWTVGKAAAYGVVVAIVAPLGDLSQSMIKRQLGLKDMGRLLPGHGGILDRVDGLLFVIPATYFVVKALHLG